jgi:hypothetical protein
MSTTSADLGLSIRRASVGSDGRWLMSRLSNWTGLVFDGLANPWVLLMCKLTIGFVSAYDIFLTIKYVESLPSLELNPVGRWMMSLDQGPACELNQIAAFITGKFAGNFLVLCIIELMAKWRHRAAAVVALSVASIQLLLFAFLQFSDWFLPAKVL